MGDGRRGTAPCGHEGEAVIGQYYACEECDVSDGVPKHVVDERTRPICRNCGSSHIAEWDPWASKDGFSLWTCRDCGKSFHA